MMMDINVMYLQGRGFVPMHVPWHRDGFVFATKTQGYSVNAYEKNGQWIVEYVTTPSSRDVIWEGRGDDVLLAFLDAVHKQDMAEKEREIAAVKLEYSAMIIEMAKELAKYREAEKAE